MKYVFAIPLEGGKLCSHFGHCEQFSIINVEDKSIMADKLVTPPPHEPGLLPRWLADMGVTNIIAGGMGQRALDLFEQNKIDVNYGAQSKTPKELVQDWLDDTLQLGGNSCDH
ncbi:MAG: NifB/NifX family molybdenum-iron cluster-binding protein [Rikenellaceae bacterium]|nr:NifB/NifX family molybdenum-iron cluster-binding protein [Rikenellaceae bacterium]